MIEKVFPKIHSEGYKEGVPATGAPFVLSRKTIDEAADRKPQLFNLAQRTRRAREKAGQCAEEGREHEWKGKGLRWAATQRAAEVAHVAARSFRATGVRTGNGLALEALFAQLSAIAAALKGAHVHPAQAQLRVYPA